MIHLCRDGLRRSDTWPVAPVDLRLNRELGLWQVKAAPDAGSAYVTEEITAAVYDDSPADDGPASGSKTITFGFWLNGTIFGNYWIWIIRYAIKWGTRNRIYYC